MTNRRKRRTTQAINEPLGPSCSTEKGNNISRMIELGEEPKRILSAICDTTRKLPEIKGAAICFSRSKEDITIEAIASSGELPLEEILHELNSYRNEISLSSLATNLRNISTKECIYFDIPSRSSEAGTLVIFAPKGVDHTTGASIRTLAHQASITQELANQEEQIEQLRERLDIQDELHTLASGLPDPPLLYKKLGEQCQKLLSFDTLIIALLNDSGDEFRVVSMQGCRPSSFPKTFPVSGEIISRALRIGGVLGYEDLDMLKNPEEIELFQKIGIRSMLTSNLETQQQCLGIIFGGYHKQKPAGIQQKIVFEEFCRGASVVISDAQIRAKTQTHTTELEKLVEKRTRELALQTNRAEEANEKKSTFIANMSHELRTPLTAIIGYGSVLKEQLFGVLNQQQTEAVESIIKSSEHLKTLIDDILNIAKIESGKEDPEAEKIQLKNLLPQAYRLMLQSAIEKGIQLKPLQLSPEVANAYLYVDPKHMHQIIINIMSNAVKYTPAGGSVSMDAEIIADKIKISIIDTGIGISKEYVEKLFERFERSEDSYTQKQEGTGIGLNLTRRLVHLNGGRIGVESVEGAGSTFWVLLPVADTAGINFTEVDRVEKEESKNIKNLTGLSTVVIDDNIDTCTVLQQVLEASGIRVRTAQSVADGVDLITEDPPDIILTDLAIPGESGIDLIERIRKSGHQEVCTVPIIVLSACVFDSDREAAMSAGASIFIPKPFNPSEILKMVMNLTAEE